MTSSVQRVHGYAYMLEFKQADVSCMRCKISFTTFQAAALHCITFKVLDTAVSKYWYSRIGQPILSSIGFQIFSSRMHVVIVHS